MISNLSGKTEEIRAPELRKTFIYHVGPYKVEGGNVFPIFNLGNDSKQQI